MRTILRQIGLAVILLAAASCAIAGPMGVGPRQRNQLKDLAMQTRRDTMRLRDELAAARNDLRQVYSVYELDKGKTKAASDRISRIQLALLNLHLENQLSLRRILNQDQFQEFNEKVNKRIGDGGPGPGAAVEDAVMDPFSGKEAMLSVGVAPQQIRRLRQGLSALQRPPAVEKLKRDSLQLVELYSHYDLDVQAAKRLIVSVHQSQSDISDTNRKRQEAFRSVLTQAQFDRLREELDKRRQQRETRRPLRRQ